MERIKAFRDRLYSCFLLGRSSAELTTTRKIWFWVWNDGLMILMALALGVLSLSLAYGIRDVAVFWGYFRSPMILLLNLLPPIVLMLTLHAATGRSWIAWLITSVLILLPSAVNFYTLSFRDDPLTASKILLFREGMAIAGNYNIVFGARMWVAILAIPVGALLLAAFVRGRMHWKPRLIVLGALLLAALPLSQLYVSETIYENYTENYDVLQRRLAADRFIGKGYVYPLLYSVGELFDDEPALQPEVELSGDEATLTVQPTAPTRPKPVETPEDTPDAPVEEPPAKKTYTNADIPAEKQVDVVMIMLEAFADLTTFGIEGIADEVYADWHAMEAESYAGTLLTNIFAAGTVNTERCVLTGDFWVPDEGYSGEIGSYVRYLDGQGYTVTGSHPIYEWFYDRGEINGWLGFESYDFWESRYQGMVGDIAEYLYRDDLFLTDVYELYLQGSGRQLVRTEVVTQEPVEIWVEVPIEPPAAELPVEPPVSEIDGAAGAMPDEGSGDIPSEIPGEISGEIPADIPVDAPAEPQTQWVAQTVMQDVISYTEHIETLTEERAPYFGFHVTYQGHATYSGTSLSWGEGHYTAPEGVSPETWHILNNYLGSVRDTIQELVILRDRLAAQEEPVVLVLFGDHKPWLGDGNSVYHELGINIDIDTEEGFYNYYSTPYLIWANDAAKELLDSDFTGEAPDISPAYLMNELFDLCGWDGPAYMQMMDDLQPMLPVVNTDGLYLEDGVFTDTLSDEGQKALDGVRQVADFRRTHALDMTIKTEEFAWLSEN